MEHVSDRLSNPFGMQPPPELRPAPDGPAVVYGYGDVNADFHVIGDHPGVHGGSTTGIPFTETRSGDRLRRVLTEVGLLVDPKTEGPEGRAELDSPGPALEPRNCFASYLHMCPPPNGSEPEPAAYRLLERFLDAELRAVNAHVLLPVGERATDHVLDGYTTQRERIELDMADLHGRHVRGRGFLVVPVADPAGWTDGEAAALTESLRGLLESDYRQTKGVATLVG